MEVFGYIRFSYLGRSDAKLSHTAEVDQEKYFRQLYEPARMEVRFHFFEKICLPSLRAQSDQKFRVFVMASEIMPDDFKERLEASVADIPQICIIYESNPILTDAFKPTVLEATKDLKENSVHFRLDDDDALGVDAIKSLKKMGAHASPQTILTMPKGFHLFSHEGKPYILPKHEPYLAIGFAFVNRPGDIKNPYACAHFQVGRRLPSIVDPRSYAYIHVAHPQGNRLNDFCRAN